MPCGRESMHWTGHWRQLKVKRMTWEKAWTHSEATNSEWHLRMHRTVSCSRFRRFSLYSFWQISFLMFATKELHFQYKFFCLDDYDEWFWRFSKWTATKNSRLCQNSHVSVFSQPICIQYHPKQFIQLMTPYRQLFNHSRHSSGDEISIVHKSLLYNDAILMIPQSFFAQQASRLDLFFMKFRYTSLGDIIFICFMPCRGDMTKMGD